MDGFSKAIVTQTRPGSGNQAVVTAAQLGSTALRCIASSKTTTQVLLLSHPLPIPFSLCSTTTPLNWDLSPSISVFTGIIGVRPDSAILDVSGRIKLCQVCESGFQFQFLQSSGNLSLVDGYERLGVAYIKVLSKLDVSLSSEINFS
jgi:hypothetical protein